MTIQSQDVWHSVDPIKNETVTLQIEYPDCRGSGYSLWLDFIVALIGVVAKPHKQYMQQAQLSG